MSNISEEGTWLRDERFKASGKWVLRKAGDKVGNIMSSWREMRWSGDPETLRWLEEVEVMQQPAGYCDGIIVAWIQEMRYLEGYTRLITVRDLFAGALSETASRSSYLCSSLRAWIGGKMTAVMQLTDTAVAFSLKRYVEAVKAEVRREKRGEADWESVWVEAGRSELKCISKDLLRILAESWGRLKHRDEVEEPDRMLRAARHAGWLSYRADPATKCLVRADEEDWLAGRLGLDELGEKSHRHPDSWWASRYEWIEGGQGGEPMKAKWTAEAGFGVSGLQSMRDEFPELGPDEKVSLKCMDLRLGHGARVRGWG